MLEYLMSKSSDPLWKTIGEKALTTAVTTLVGELVKAAVDIQKRRKLRRDQADFDDARTREREASDPPVEDEPAAPDGEAEGEPDGDSQPDVLSFEAFLQTAR